ncbi:MAG TPA: 50S ribosomal protein L15 [Candidatus Saccharimonadales bacterium]|nr:50S ribosomal protein L15 [Candidatus Saccharimonadales bacterium]
MKFNEVNTIKLKNPKRVGRGISGGQGKTAGRGTKGQNSRAGSSKKPGFEGGQNPLMQRLPKLRGVTKYRHDAEEVYTGQLDAFSSKVIDSTLLAEHKLITSPYANVKLLVKGELTKKVSVKLPAASKLAIDQIQKNGGTFEATDRLKRPKLVKKDKE